MPLVGMDGPIPTVSPPPTGGAGGARGADGAEGAGGAITAADLQQAMGQLLTNIKSSFSQQIQTLRTRYNTDITQLASVSTPTPPIFMSLCRVKES